MKQTYITILEDNNGKEITFERWGYKKVKTVKSKIIELYSNHFFIYRNYIEKCDFLVIYETPEGCNGEHIEVERISKDELLKEIA